MKNKLISVLVLFAILLTLFTFPFHALSLYTDGDYTYADIDQNNVALYAYSGESDILTIPDSFSSRVVSEIYDYSFENNTAITQLDFSQNPNHVNYIGTRTFAGCTGLTGELFLPSSIKNMGYAAFQECSGLSSLVINVGIKTIPVQCFNRCSGLKMITLAPTVESIENLAFANCTGLGSVYIPDSVTYISDSAFKNSYPTLYVNYGSYAQQYAESKGIYYIVIDHPEPTETPTEPTEEPTQPEQTDTPTEVAPTQSETTETPTEIEPTMVPTEEPTQADGYFLGDFNGDGVVDIIDATLIQRYCAKLLINVEFEILHGDVNENNSVDDIDATLIRRFLAGVEVYYPIGEWKSS